MTLARGDPALLPMGYPRGNPREQAARPSRTPIRHSAKRERPAATASGWNRNLSASETTLEWHRAAPTGRRTSARAFGNMVACPTTAGGPTLRQDMPLLPLPARAARRAETANCAAPQNGSARRSRAIALNTATPPASHWGVRSRSIPIIAPHRAAANMCPPFVSI